MVDQVDLLDSDDFELDEEAEKSLALIETQHGLATQDSQRARGSKSSRSLEQVELPLRSKRALSEEEEADAKENSRAYPRPRLEPSFSTEVAEDTSRIQEVRCVAVSVIDETIVLNDQSCFECLQKRKSNFKQQRPLSKQRQAKYPSFDPIRTKYVFE